MSKINTKLLDNIPISSYISFRESPYKYNDLFIPRVTEILQFIDMESLIGWANYIGFKHIKQTDVLEEAARIGSQTHGIIENYLKNGSQIDDNIPFRAFKKWWQKINEDSKVEILGQEESLSCQYFGGTYDMLMKKDNRIILVDFKTSNHVGYKYFMQLAAYRDMLWLNKKISINGCIVLQLDKNIEEYKDYYLDFENPEQYSFIENCTQAFFSVVNCYYNTVLIKNQFKDIF